jgi:hypothetical protein
MRDDRKYAIHTLVAQAGLHGSRVFVLAGIAEDVDGIIVRPALGELFIELPAGRVGQLREHQVAVHQKVRRHHPGTAPVGDDSEPRPARAHARVQGLRHGEEIGIVVHAHDTGTIQCCIEYVVGADECTGVRHRRAAALRETPRLHHDHWLGARRGPQRTHETARLVNTFDVQHDRLRHRVDHEVIEDLAEIEVRRDTAGNNAGKADVARTRPVEHRGAHRTRLRYQRDLSRFCHALAERRVEVDGGTHHAETVRPDEADPVAPGPVEHSLLQCATVLAGLAEARREDDGRGYFAGSAIVEHVRHGLRRRHDDREFDRFPDVPQRRKTGSALHAGVLRIHGIDRSLEAGIHEVPENDRAQRTVTFTGPNQCHRRGLENRSDIRPLICYVLHASFP